MSMIEMTNTSTSWEDAQLWIPQQYLLLNFQTKPWKDCSSWKKNIQNNMMLSWKRNNNSGKRNWKTILSIREKWSEMRVKSLWWNFSSLFKILLNWGTLYPWPSSLIIQKQWLDLTLLSNLHLTFTSWKMIQSTHMWFGSKAPLKEYGKSVVIFIWMANKQKSLKE